MDRLAKYFPQKTPYIDRCYAGSPDEYLAALEASPTVFVNDIPLHVHEERIWHLFKLCGPIKRIIVGVNNEYFFCGFAFVEFASPSSAEAAVKIFTGYKIDSISIKVDRDVGFNESRRFGRGADGNKRNRRDYYANKKSKRIN